MSTEKTIQEYRDQTAKAAANFVRECLFHRHRGVINCGDKIIVYGNDGYSKDERARKEVEGIRAELNKLELKEGAFAVDDEEGYSWAILIENYQGLPIDCDDLAAKLAAHYIGQGDPIETSKTYNNIRQHCGAGVC